VAEKLGVPHIAVGDLLRNEVKQETDQGKKLRNFMEKGLLVPDETVLEILGAFLDQSKGENPGFVLDGYPRTAKQAIALSQIEQVHLVLNLFLREDVLIEKCMGRRICTKCNGNYNIADIYRPADDKSGKPEIIMPPLPIPDGCKDHIVTRKDDTEEVIRNRLRVYKEESSPLEEFYREKAILTDFEIVGGIPLTFPRLISVIRDNKR